MLTKEERKAIAERIGKEFDYTENDEVYEALIGEEIPDDTTWGTDCKVARNRLIELCDTSNMVELPLDKDGEVIHIGDTVFDDYGSEWRVNSIDFKSNGVLIDVFLDGECTKFLPSQLTHKQPVTIQKLSERMQAVIDAYGLAGGSDLSMKLVDIADQLKELAGKDD